MIESIIIDYLSENLVTTGRVSAEMPEDQTGAYVVIYRTGSRVADRIRTATIAIQSYGDSLLDAIRLNEEVRTVMDGITSRDDISGCHFQTDYNLTNTAKKQYRYEAVFEITY